MGRLLNYSSPKITDINVPTRQAFLLHILNRTHLSLTVHLTALLYLKRLKDKYPHCTGSFVSGHRLLLAALIAAAKYLTDDTFDNRAWASVSSGLFTFEDVNAMEVEFMGYMDYRLYI
ncbi:uncharacterized protein BJ171DRAFT_422821, partial [Polychytrium aggregatum]|uniref:uncharacterized protein n=1 Tax=Polychytrium aggregatum TaxID=110093 RepID=UPI0022FDD828